MSNDKGLPEVTLDQIRAWTSEASFGRGDNYFRQGNILSPRRQERTLRAECLGSQPSPYRVKVTLGETGIAAGSCSCPIGTGGHCKHAVALLLTWLHEPERFTEMETLATALEGLAREELVALIQKMVMRYPDLESMLTLKTLSKPSTAQTLSPEPIRNQVTRALFSHGHDWQSGHYISAELSEIVALGDGFAEREDWANAALVYMTIAETVRAAYDQIFDHDGDVIVVVADCVAGLGDCLKAAPDLASRTEILRTLFDLYQWDTGLGGYGAADEVPGLLLDIARSDERRVLSGWVREALPASSTAEDRFYHDWQRRTLGGFLLDLEADQLNNEQYLELCRETGRYEELIDRLLGSGRATEAVAEAKRFPDYQLSTLADLFVAHGHGDLAQTLVTDRWEQSEDSRLLSWLQRYAEQHGQPERALELAQMQFWQGPSVAGYQELRRLAEPLGRWSALSAKVLSRLAAEGYDDQLVRIHLEEGAAEAALQAFEVLAEKEEQRRQSQIGGWSTAAALRLPVATAIEASHPWKAVALIKPIVDDLIAARGRGNYARAARHLQTVRDIYAAQGAMEEWQAFIGDLKEENRRLPALQDELKKAGL